MHWNHIYWYTSIYIVIINMVFLNALFIFKYIYKKKNKISFLDIVKILLVLEIQMGFNSTFNWIWNNQITVFQPKVISYIKKIKCLKINSIIIEFEGFFKGKIIKLEKKIIFFGPIFCLNNKMYWLDLNDSPLFVSTIFF